MNKITAIETIYKGCRFRSRLEARWAVFFDACGLRWEYEPEGFEIDGEKYLPDFYLPDLDTYAEVKGQRPGYEQEILKLQKFIVWGGPIKQIVILSDIPNPTEIGMPHFPSYYWSARQMGAESGWYFFQDDSDNAGVIGHVSKANYRLPQINEWSLKNNKFSIAAISDFVLHGPYPGFEPQWDAWMKDVNQIVFSALEAARSARFEYGENGAAI